MATGGQFIVICHGVFKCSHSARLDDSCLAVMAPRSMAVVRTLAPRWKFMLASAPPPDSR